MKAIEEGESIDTGRVKLSNDGQSSTVDILEFDLTSKRLSAGSI